MCPLPGGWVALAAGFVSGFLIATFAEVFRRWLLRPVLEASFGGAGSLVQTPVDTPTNKKQARYVRVRVRITNRFGETIARGCRAYLIDVERWESGEFQSTNFVDSLRLIWSNQPSEDVAKPIDIPRRAYQYIDLVSATSISPNAFTTHVIFRPFIYEALFDPTPKKLRYTVLVTGDGAEHATTRVVFDWKGAWDTFEATAG